MAASKKPVVLMCSTPVSGHIIPMLSIARALVARDYDVCFVSGSGYRQQVEAAGARFMPVEGYGDYYDLTSWDLDPLCMYSLYLLPLHTERPTLFLV
jgi:hypothetical protein